MSDIKNWNCLKCDCIYSERPEDKHSDDLDSYMRFCGICGEHCLNKFSKDEQHKLSVKLLLEGEGLKLKYNRQDNRSSNRL